MKTIKLSGTALVCCAVLLQMTFLHIELNAQPITFQKEYGGSGDDLAYEMCRTHDGGYALVGATTSFGHGQHDLYLTKLDGLGEVEWSKALGDAHLNRGYDIIECSDHGFIVVGSTITDINQNEEQILVIRTDELGNVIWSKESQFGNWEYASDVKQTTDGGFIITGRTDGYGAGGFDAFLLRLTSSGATSWFRTYGGPETDIGLEVEEAPSGDFLLTGATSSFGSGGLDAFLIRTNPSGTALVFAYTYGDSKDNVAQCMEPVINGGSVTGYVLAGYHGILNQFINITDVFFVETTTGGALLNSAIINFTGFEGVNAQDIKQSAPGVFALSGTGYFSGGSNALFLQILSSPPVPVSVLNAYVYDFDASAGIEDAGDGFAMCGFDENPVSNDFDMSLIRTNENGQSGCEELQANTEVNTPTINRVAFTPTITTADPMENGPEGVLCAETITAIECYEDDGVDITNYFDESIGECGIDEAFAMDELVGGGYVIGGRSSDLAAITVLDASGTVVRHRRFTFQGPSSALSSSINSVASTPDGGFIAAGNAFFPVYNEQMIVMKVDASGNVTWITSWGDADDDVLMSIKPTSDGGYVATGYKTSRFQTPLFEEILRVMKFDAHGGLEWANYYFDFEQSTFTRGYEVIETSDCGYMVAGRHRQENDNVYLLALKLNSAGGVMFDNGYLISTNPADYTPLRPSVTETHDGGYRFADFYDDPTLGHNIYLVHMDNAGTTVSEYGFWIGNNASEEYTTSINQNADGTFLVAMNGLLGGSLFKVDIGSNAGPATTYDTDAFTILDALQTADGAYAAVGNTLRRGVNGDMLALHTNIYMSTGACSDSYPLHFQSVSKFQELDLEMDIFHVTGSISYVQEDLPYHQLDCNDPNYMCKSGAGVPRNTQETMMYASDELFEIYPNPAQSGGSIQLNLALGASRDFEFVLTTITGAVVLRHSGTSSSSASVYELSLPDIVPGTYQAAVKSGGRTSSRLMTVWK